MFCFEIGFHIHSLGWPQTHYIVVANLELLIFCLHLPSAGTAVPHHAMFLKDFIDQTCCCVASTITHLLPIVTEYSLLVSVIPR